MMPDRKPDAILSPSPYAPGVQRQHWFAEHLYPLLASHPKELVGAKQQGENALIAPLDATLLFPVLHPLAGRERYDWFVVAENASLQWLPMPVKVDGYATLPGAVKFGYLKDEATVTQPGQDERADFAAFVARRTAKFAELNAKIRANTEKPNRTPQDDEERAALVDELSQLAAETFGTNSDPRVVKLPKWASG